VNLGYSAPLHSSPNTRNATLKNHVKIFAFGTAIRKCKLCFCSFFSLFFSYLYSFSLRRTRGIIKSNGCNSLHVVILPEKSRNLFYRNPPFRHNTRPNASNCDTLTIYWTVRKKKGVILLKQKHSIIVTMI